MQNLITIIILLISCQLQSQYFPFKNGNQFDAKEYKRIKDSLLNSEKGNSQINGNQIVYDSKNGTSIIMTYDKSFGGFIQITKGSHWIMYNYFKNLSLQYRKEFIGKHWQTGIWKEYNEEKKSLIEEDNDILYDESEKNKAQNIKLINLREIAKNLKNKFKLDIFTDDNFWNINIRDDEKTNQLAYNLIFANEDRFIHIYKFNAYNGSFISEEIEKLEEETYLH